MKTSVPFRDFWRYPITVSVAVAALAVTLFWWTDHDIAWAFGDFHLWENAELQRAFTSCLPHVNVLHLAFNLYWWWVFAPRLEAVFGHARFAGLVVVLALSSSLADYGLSYGGVGLSGVGYGLWGFLWALQPRDPRFADAMDPQTNFTFFVWFFACLATTQAGLMPVANVAHGVGAIMGGLLGFALAGERWQRRLARGLSATLLGFSLLSATWCWPAFNLTNSPLAEYERAGLAALDQDHDTRACQLLECATRRPGADSRTWYNLGIAQQRLEQYAAALASYQKAAELPGAIESYQQIYREMKEYVDRRNSRAARAAGESGRPASVSAP